MLVQEGSDGLPPMEKVEMFVVKYGWASTDTPMRQGISVHRYEHTTVTLTHQIVNLIVCI